MPPAAVATILHIGSPRSALSSHSFIDVMKFLDVYIDKFREIPKAELLLLKLIKIFARAVLVMKKLEIEETKTT